MSLKCLRVLAAVAAVLLPAAVLQAGGWVVISLSTVPESLTAGRPVTITYAVRQHGHTLMNDLDGRIEARRGDTLIRAKAQKLPPDGSYAATLTIPEPGAWTLAVVGGSGLLNDTVALPIQIVAAGARPEETSSSARGRVLFQGKGCVSCHAHNAFETPQTATLLNLSARRYTSEGVKAFLTAIPTMPAATSESGTGRKMPNLGLVEHEIDSLAAFLSR
jgi:mono/diheme cytochrome c family protein